MFALGKLGGEKPAVFLAGEEIAWELAQGDAAVDCGGRRGGRRRGCGGNLCADRSRCQAEGEEQGSGYGQQIRSSETTHRRSLPQDASRSRVN